MSRKLVWIEQQRFLGFGCSECVWVFNPTGEPTGNSFAEMMKNFELQRDKEFALHVCADHPGVRAPRARTLNNSPCKIEESFTADELTKAKAIVRELVSPSLRLSEPRRASESPFNEKSPPLRRQLPRKPRTHPIDKRFERCWCN
jgi:hypothetical protein